MSGVGIFCIETGSWGESLMQRMSIQPALGLLNSVNETRYFHRNASTAGEFWHYLEQWKLEGRRSYPILYFCFHGAPDQIQFSDGDVTLAEIESCLSASCSGSIVYFSSCETLRLDDRRLQSFLDRTGALAIGGYRKSVNWMESAAFELLFLSEACTPRRIDVRTARRLKRTIDQRHSQLAGNLEFRFLIGNGRRRTNPKTAHRYRVGDVVRAYYDGTLFDPCVVQELQWSDGEPTYNVYFDADQTQVDGVLAEEIAGESDKKPIHDSQPAATNYRVGDFVKALYDGVEHDPCLIEEVVVKRGVPEFTIYFDVDCTIVRKMTLAAVTGRSTKPLLNHPEIPSGEVARSEPKWKHGDIVKAMFGDDELEARVIRVNRDDITVHWGVDNTLSECSPSDILGRSTTPWELDELDEDA